ncbi:putative nitrogen fixation protein NifT [Celerinatantimonas sp. YJH-8]|uniref:putative nitrogen fixation protein NifT n=1 Tax=Celerinatantimonas sp. YJH-8 TaxID=3228714 RepID=UPI0038C570E8
MPNVIFRQQTDGLYAYIAKRDLEAKVVNIEFDSPDHWGGKIELANGQSWFLTPQPRMPSFPITLRLSRAAE